jgi:type VI secretion system secreted protein VgrG
MSDDNFTLDASPLGSDVVLVAFRGHEHINQPFRFVVWVTVPLDAVPSPGDVLGQALTLSIEGNEPGTAPQPTNGIITRLDEVDETEERALLRVEVRPKLWLLSLSEHSRSYVDKTLEEVLEETLQAAGLSGSDYRLDLEADYPTRSHVTQYKESDLHFVTRLLERDGAYFFFEHEDGAHKLVIADHPSFHSASRSTALKYQPGDGGDLGPDLFDRFSQRRRLVTGKLRHTGYDPESPSLGIDGDDQSESPGGTEAVVHNSAFDPSDASRLATIDKERALAEESRFDGRGHVYHLRCGFRFSVEDHPRSSGEYLCISLRQAGNLGAKSKELAAKIGLPADLVYEVALEAIGSGVTYRPPRSTAAPMVAGFERALVDGPGGGDYAQLDDQGRYLVKLAYDETDGAGDSASRRMRMTQPHAGSPEGWHLPLRKGTEVMVAFLGGDPDCPVIAGAVPNAETPAVVTSDNHSKNIFHSGGDNVIEIEDEAGAQWVDVRSPPQDSHMHLGTPHDPTHYVVLHTDADAWFYFGSNQDILVGGNLTEEVTDVVEETYNTSQTSKVKGPQDTTVIGDVEEIYKTGHKTTVTDKVSEVYIGTQKTDVAGDRFELYDSNQKSLVVGGADHTYDSQDASILSAPSTQVYGGNKKLTATAGMDLTFDSSVNQIYGPTTYVTLNDSWKVKGPGVLFTPSYTQIVVTDSQLQSNVNTVSAGVTFTYNLGLALVTLKIEVVGASAGVTGFKFEDTLITGAVWGALFNQTLIELDTSGVKLNAAPLKKYGC